MARLAPSSIREAFDLTGVHAEATRGPWRIEHKVIEEEAAKLGALRAAIGGSGRYVPPGKYTGLIHERRGIVMSDTPDEMNDHFEPFYKAKTRGGRVLINGLGLGMVLKGILSLPNVEHVDVVEIDEDVIALCSPPFVKMAGDRLTIHHDDAFTKQWPKGTRWSVAWHDVWDVLNVDNLSNEDDAFPGTYAKLNRRYGRRVDWQGAWGQDLLKHQARQSLGWY